MLKSPATEMRVPMCKHHHVPYECGHVRILVVSWCMLRWKASLRSTDSNTGYKYVKTGLVCKKDIVGHEGAVNQRCGKIDAKFKKSGTDIPSKWNVERETLHLVLLSLVHQTQEPDNANSASVTRRARRRSRAFTWKGLIVRYIICQ